MLDEVTELMNRVESNKSQINYLSDENKRLLDDIIALQWGIAKGDEVVDKEGGKYIVTEFQFWGTKNPPWVSGRRYRKDGTVSHQIRHLYSEWRKVDDSDVEQ